MPKNMEYAEKEYGIIVKTPDGTKRYVIKVDNDGNIITELVE